MALPATDTFTHATNGTDVPTYNASWTYGTGGRFLINTNAAYPWMGNNVHGCMLWNADVFGNDQYSTGTIVAIGTGAHLGVAVRCISSAKTFYGYEGDSVDSSLYKEVAGVLTVFGSIMGPWVVSDLIRIEANGTTIEAKRNSVSAITQTDSSIASGSAGLCGEDNITTLRIDNWEGSDLVTGPATSFLPFQRPMLHMIVR